MFKVNRYMALPLACATIAVALGLVLARIMPTPSGIFHPLPSLFGYAPCPICEEVGSSLFKYDLSPGVDTGQRVLFGVRGVSPSFHRDGPLKGQSLNAVAEKLRRGELSPDAIPVSYIWVNGLKVTINNRSLAALAMAGLKPTKVFDVSGKLPKVGTDSLPYILQRLDEIGGKPSETLPIRSTKSWSSSAREIVSIIR